MFAYFSLSYDHHGPDCRFQLRCHDGGDGDDNGHKFINRIDSSNRPLTQPESTMNSDSPHLEPAFLGPRLRSSKRKSGTTWVASMSRCETSQET